MYQALSAEIQKAHKQKTQDWVTLINMWVLIVTLLIVVQTFEIFWDIFSEDRNLKGLTGIYRLMPGMATGICADTGLMA